MNGSTPSQPETGTQARKRDGESRPTRSMNRADFTATGRQADLRKSPFPITGPAEAISMMTAKAVSRIRRPAATLGTRVTGPCGCSPSLRQFPAERGTNGD